VIARPYKSADAVLTELGISKPSEIDVEAIAQYLGATVLYQPLTGCDARILGNADEAIITVDSISNRGRQRFSVGHELGHWMRDRGKLGFACSSEDLQSGWKAGGSEQRANEYAADLLLPVSMFRPRCKGKEVVFDTVKALAAEFETSITATVVRLVQHGWLPAMLLYVVNGKRKWFIGDPDLPKQIWPHEVPKPATVTAELMHRHCYSGPEAIQADGWIEHPQSKWYEVVEDVFQLSPSTFLTLLWWKNERQLLDFES
jgi:Zn-dependent peptidase ImmA (M78 family)